MQRCAGLQVDVGQSRLKAWGLKEHSCVKASPGYICKSSYAGTCPALHPASGSRGTLYRVPFQLQSVAVMEFSPPGTELSIRCPGREARFTCHLSPDGAHWEGTEQRLCSCPSGYWSPSKEDCAELTDCISAEGAFSCWCVSRSRLRANEESCVVPGRGGAVTAQPILSSKSAASETFFANSTSRPGQNISWPEPESFPPRLVNITTKDLAPSNASDYIIILITVAVVMLVVLVLAALQVFQICFKICSCKDSQPPKAGTEDASAKDEVEASGTGTSSEVH